MMNSDSFFEQSIRKIAGLENFNVFRALRELKKVQPAIHNYVESATEGISESAFDDLVRAAYGAWQVSQEDCTQLRRVSAEHLDALHSKNFLDLDLLERVDDPEFLLKHYRWLGPLALVLPSARQKAQTEEHHRFLLHAKTILDAFAQAARLSPPFSPQNVHEYEIRITLDEIAPEIYRTVRVSGGINLRQLHNMIQAVMGWFDCHLHSFEMEGIEFGTYDPEEEMTFVDEKRFRLEELARGQTIRVKYVYDFGDCWSHKLDIKPIGKASNPKPIPVCLEGARACPPEDSGGLH
ncbi:MAG TPA: plasmid pRiA4b ORF-3 family protein, partial [Candidatus Hodarchaeales archaeon]|nr:plasmid pRiA4b ORF-3 family protein [Candidatus Hodarchaeales archaeon]